MTITVNAKGTFNHAAAGGIECYIKRDCIGSGKIVLRADDYETNKTIIGTDDDLVVYMDTATRGYWNGSYVWIVSGNAHGQS
ncbi:MAG: hypothetical protein WC491_07195, partial [Candidatus Omnitrophota bacterium]